MNRPTKQDPDRGDARTRLLESARDVIRTQGFAATSVDQLCQAAGVTKGAFFHHFASKEALGVAAAQFWAETTSELFANASYHDHAEPLDRVLAYIDFRRDLIAGELEEFTCLIGTMTQEAYAKYPAIREACAISMFGHTSTLEPDIQAAMEASGISGSWTAASLARHMQAVLQGAFILAKAGNDSSLAIESVDHLRRYVELLFKNRPKGGQND
ncbi:TetR/AcrR family transcriptional regulator [Paracoccus onubensis]|uniref:TetR/AcrR family transcriptional regulator n=1 Tax=Paracoccus onubensis TaxID=1675788 RepID=A0A418T426_9RHOB|nr:TetR/AcrR family transcriptional regulator [Paracoccus onubensis]RJE87925.1 TetR/AcrR family transcriptional regulator [Paracoccus onubensis]